MYQGKCGRFDDRPFKKGCSGKAISFGEGLTETQCEEKCTEAASKHGAGCCRNIGTSTSGWCAFFSGGTEIANKLSDSKSMQCTGNNDFRAIWFW